MPKFAKKCIKSWRRFCSDYEIVEWNEDNFDISECPLYVRQAYNEKKWAFVTDYVRLKVVYENGGIYLDTDVEIIKPLDQLLVYDAYFGFESGKYIATGLGFGAVQYHELLKEIMDDYNEIPFILENGEYDLFPCPVRNTTAFLNRGLVQNDTLQKIDNTIILPTEWLCPIDYQSGHKKITENTLSIHHFSATWMSEAEKKKHNDVISKNKKNNTIHSIKHLPNFVLMKILGDNLYGKIKSKLKK